MSATLISDLRPRVQAALADSPVYELRNLNVEQREGKLIIIGSVSSFYHKQLAQEVVRSVCRDSEIHNAILVKYGSGWARGVVGIPRVPDQNSTSVRLSGA